MRLVPSPSLDVYRSSTSSSPTATVACAAWPVAETTLTVAGFLPLTSKDIPRGPLSTGKVASKMTKSCASSPREAIQPRVSSPQRPSADFKAAAAETFSASSLSNAKRSFSTLARRNASRACFALSSSLRLAWSSAARIFALAASTLDRSNTKTASASSSIRRRSAASTTRRASSSFRCNSAALLRAAAAASACISANDLNSATFFFSSASTARSTSLRSRPPAAAGANATGALARGSKRTTIQPFKPKDSPAPSPSPSAASSTTGKT
mmetsp:Transcript_6495/g.20889  ORF Transcript_6495/g.20889 Transcript_6495/m.20889 type:complete len:268 (-) Transcript_6495:269-1072(-)